MRRSTWACGVGILLVVAGACKARQPEAEYRPTATVKDIMDSLVDPSADTLWDSVETIISAAGIEEKAPHTDEEWWHFSPEHNLSHLTHKGKSKLQELIRQERSGRISFWIPIVTGLTGLIGVLIGLLSILFRAK